MSIRVQNWVYEHSEARGNDRLVLLAIADEADDDGTNAFPGIDRISHKARIPKRTTMRCIERLEEAGDLLVKRPEVRGRGHFNTYVVVMGQQNGATLTPFSQPQERREKARKGAQPLGLCPRPTDPQTPVVEPVDEVLPLVVSETPSVAERFGIFWDAYPARDGKKIGKLNAKRLFERLSLEEQRAAWRGAVNLAKAVAEGGVFGIHDPERFLSKRRWEDWQTPAVVASRSSVRATGVASGMAAIDAVLGEGP